MTTTYTFTNSNFTTCISLGIPVNQLRLSKEIQSSSITNKLINILQKPIGSSGNVQITFSGSLSVPNLTTLSTSIVPNHPNNNISPPIVYNTKPTTTNDESTGYYAGDVWINATNDTTRSLTNIKRVWHCVNGYKNNAEWIRCNQKISELQDVDTTFSASGNVLTLSGNLWVPKNIGTLFPATGSLFFSAGNNSITSTGRYYGQGSTSTTLGVIDILSSFNVAPSNTLTLYCTAGTLGQNISTGTIRLVVNSVLTNFFVTIPAGIVVANSGYTSSISASTLQPNGGGPTIIINLYSRLSIFALPNAGNWGHSSTTFKIFQ